MPSAPVPVLTVTTRPAEPAELLALASPDHPLVWLRNGEGFAGLGEALRLEFRGPDRFRDAEEAFARLVERAAVDDTVQAPGSGLVAFGAFGFADETAAASVLVVPRLLVGLRHGRAFVTRVDGGAEPTPTPVPDRSYDARFSPARMSPERYREAVASALRRIGDERLDKVVLARDVAATLPAQADLRTALARFARDYPDCWTFAVDGLLGASPETLVTLRQGRLGARVLAGSTARGADEAADAAQANALLVSAKDLDEHDFAVVSVLSALAPFAADLAASPAPFPLRLANVWHLASDVEGRLANGTGALRLLEALHPTAAVAGTPTADALRVIEELEPFDRGRYAGPVGWLDAAGNGEWALALRCAQVSPEHTVTAYAGAGIVAGSDPAREFAETSLKLKPVEDAFA